MEKTPTHRFSKTAAYLVAAAAVMPLTAVQAQEGGLSELARQEIARRKALVGKADEAIDAARKAYTNKKYQEAVNQYKEALRALPPGRAVAKRRKFVIESLSDASVALAKQKVRLGDKAAARDLVENVLKADPDNARAKKQLAYLDDPIRTSPVSTIEHTKNVDKVRRLLYQGEGYYNLGQFDKAFKTFEDVLRIDEHNTAARRWMERVHQEKADYYRSAYDEARARFLMQVDAAWEIAAPPKVVGIQQGPSGGSVESGAILLHKKLQNIILPKVDFEKATIETVVEVLRLQAREFDPDPDEKRKGLDFVIRKPRVEGDGADIADENTQKLIVPKLQLTNVPLGEVLRQVCEATTPRLRVKVEEYVVALVPATTISETELYQRTWSVPPDFKARLGGSDIGGGGGGAADDPFGSDADGGAPAKVETIQEMFIKAGVAFPEGATATFIPATSTLVVRNTASNIDIIESIVEKITNTAPRQINIMTKFVEISQQDNEELSFDWVISPFGVTANNMFLGGGTIGNGSTRSATDFVTPVNFQAINGIPGSGDVFNTPTGGLRSGDTAITRDSIDFFLNNPDRTAQSNNVAPGILSLTGLFTDGQVQMIMRGLAQKKGSDVMNAPSVMARSGERARIEVVRQFIYPTEYEPPEIPNNIGGGGIGGGGGGANGGANNFTFIPVTPATPTAFEEKPTGVILEIEPTLGEDKYTINLTLSPEIVEFEGFINYGSPIQAVAVDALGNPVQLTITENRIEMPVFSRRKVQTGLTIYDGHTVAIGGLIREEVQKVEDKVPVLGDLPLIGRLFQSNAENRIKSNLIVFVTAQIVDAAGRRVNNPDGSPIESNNLQTGTTGSIVAPDFSGGVLPSYKR